MLEIKCVGDKFGMLTPSMYFDILNKILFLREVRQNTQPREFLLQWNIDIIYIIKISLEILEVIFASKTVLILEMKFYVIHVHYALFIS